MVEVTKEQAFEVFPNRCVYWREPNDPPETPLHQRAWWSQIGTKFHVFPEGEGFIYYLKK